MQATISLRDMFSYSVLPLVILVIIIVVLILCLFIKPRKRKDNLVVVQPSYKDRNMIKVEYLNYLNNLIRDVNENKVSNRVAYQRLSSLIRNFIYEMTKIKVQYCTLSDIEYLNMPVLYDLVKEYYHPEFARNSESKVLESISKTKGVIERWN